MLFALYEFEDKSIEVGSVDLIKDKDDSNGGVINLINKTVTVCWPNTASGSASGAGGGRKNSAATASTCSSSSSSSTEHRAVVLAVNESKLRLIAKRNKICDGLSMDTDVETGRGKRRKVPIKRFSSSESDSEDEPAVAGKEPSKPKAKKARTDRSLEDCNQMAQNLRKRLLEEKNTGQSKRIETASTVMDVSSDDEELTAQQQQIKELQKALEKERAAKERVQQQLLLMQGIPAFIKSFRGFMTDMKAWTMKSQAPVQQNPVQQTPVQQTLVQQTPVQQTEQRAEQQANVAGEEEVHAHDIMITMGPNVKLPKSLVARCNPTSSKKYTSDLMMALFGRDVLVSSTLTGGKNNKGETKPALDKEKVDALISHVQSKFGCTATEIRLVITTKLNNEAKMQKKRTVNAQPL